MGIHHLVSTRYYEHMPAKPKRLSLETLAGEFGVSRTTVSNAYNHPEQLSPQLRSAILARAEALGYPGPDPAARSLRTKRTGSIGVLLTDYLSYAFEDVASVDFLAGLADACSGLSSLTLLPAGPSTAQPKNARQLIHSAMVDGFIVYSVAQGDQYLEAVKARRVPTVICDQPADDSLPFVGIDDFAAIAPAAHALISAGHRRIGILCIRLDIEANNGFVAPERLATARHHVQRSRVLGALDVFAQAGIDPHTVPIVERHINDHPNTVDAARQLLCTHPDLTAVLCTTDTMALGTLEFAQAASIHVPGTLSVTGFDGIRPALHLGLSTILQPNRDKGSHAGAVLVDLLAAKEVNKRTLLATSFEQGRTIAAPRVLI